MKGELTYKGKLKQIGESNEKEIIKWFEGRKEIKKVSDVRGDPHFYRLDVDFLIEGLSGEMTTYEIKADNYISKQGNLCFELFRIYHNDTDNNWFYLGWGYRSGANYLIVRNPKTRDAFIFSFHELRSSLGKWVDLNSGKLATEIIQTKSGSRTKYMTVVETNKEATTFNLLVPMSSLKGKYKHYKI